MNSNKKRNREELFEYLEKEKRHINKELNKNFFGLKFSNNLEEKFLNYYYNKMKESMTTSVLLGVIIYILFGLLDYLIYPDYFSKIILIRYGLTSPLLILIGILIFKAKKDTNVQMLFSIALIVAGISILIMISMVNDPTHRYYVGFIIVLLYAYIAVGLRFKYASVVGLFFIGIYLTVGLLIYHPQDNFLISNTFFLIFINIIGLISSFLFEKHERKLFLLSSLVETESKELEISNKKLKELSITDPLTDIANRRYFNQVFEKEWARALRYKVPLSLIMIDIDFFKTFNDLLGHKKGDEILVEVSKIFTEFTRRAGDLASRYGGEEFLLVFYDTSSEKAIKIAEDIRKRILNMNFNSTESKERRTLTISLGVATAIPSKDLNGEKLIIAADDVLYLAKRKGRNRVESILI